MFKRISALVLIFLLIMFCGNSFASYEDPFHLSASGDINLESQKVYSKYGNGDADFFYPLRDVSRVNRYSEVAGPQWFATVYENYSTRFYDTTTTTTTTTGWTPRGVYRRTMGGEIDDISVSLIGDILDGFNFVFAEEPEPYEAWLNRGIIDSNDYDIYPDPLESLCVVTTNGQATLNVNFANPYARHFPFWWNWTTNTASSAWRWWQNNYNWRNTGFYTVEPVAYIYNPSDNGIYTRGYNGLYSKTYNITTSGDALYVNDTSGNVLYISSGDLSGSYSFCSGDTVFYVVSGDAVYDSSENLIYTVETALGGDNCYYICEVRNIAEAITIDGFNDYDYDIRINPNTEKEIASQEYLNAVITIRSGAETYGSKLGYITFKQRASFMPGYTNFREASPIPFVIANVSDGNAADNPLIFDMAIYDPNRDNRVVKRVKFTWDAQSDLTQDLGTFFMMEPLNPTSSRPYTIETKITNRTGTRYLLYRYDRLNPGYETRTDIYPKYWQYDLTNDIYGTLPNKMLFDAHTQIAPGLVTVYGENMDMATDTSASFRLYEYGSSNPKDLTLAYKRVAGMYVNGEPVMRVNLNSSTSDDLVTVQPFSMYFANQVNNGTQSATSKYIKSLTGKTPVIMITPAEITPYETYISSSALNAFAVSEDVPEELQTLVSYDEIVTNESSTTSDDSSASAETESESQTEPETATEENAATASFYLSDTTYTTDSSNNMAVQPIAVRLKISRNTQLLKDIWEKLEAAENSKALFNTFAEYGAIWVRASTTIEYDTNLFTAINKKGSSLGVSASDCVNAAIDGNYLYLDFMIFMADAVSQKTGTSAFIEIFEDDNVPYILIGDGEIDKRWELAFYVDKAGENPMTSSTSSTVTNSNAISASSGSGGSCNAGFSFIPFVMLGFALMFNKKKK